MLQATVARRLEQLTLHLCSAQATPCSAVADADGGSIVDLKFFNKNGYVVVKQVVPKANVDAVLRDMETFLGIDLACPDDWYSGGGKYGETKYEIGAGMVEMYQRYMSVACSRTTNTKTCRDCTDGAERATHLDACAAKRCGTIASTRRCTRRLRRCSELRS